MLGARPATVKPDTADGVRSLIKTVRGLLDHVERPHVDARSTRDEVRALPDALAQARALVTIGGRPLVVVTAAVDQQAGWLEAQDELVGLSVNHSHRVIATATHSSIILGAEAPASAKAILDVLAAARTGTAVR